MPYRRIAAAAAILLAATYLKLCIPIFAAEAVPALQSAMDVEQITIYVPEQWLADFGSD